MDNLERSKYQGEFSERSVGILQGRLCLPKPAQFAASSPDLSFDLEIFALYL